MKNLLLLILGLILGLSPLSLFSQAPEGVNYQGIVRNSLGLPLNNQPVDVRFTIHQASTTGPSVFTETHPSSSTSTNQFGLINLELGSVNNVAFSAINWGAGAYFLQVEVDPGSGFEDLGASQLLSVPYALFAKSAATGAQGLNSLLDTLDAGSSCPNGGYQVLMGLDANSNTVLEAGEVSSSFYVCNGTPGTTNFNDTSSTNELQTLSINANNDTIFLTNGGFVELPPAAADNDWIVTGNDMNSGVSGNVGIGTSTPSKKLSIETTTVNGDGIQINNSSSGSPGIEFQTQGSPRYVLGVHQADNNKFKIGTTDVNVSTRFTINNQGHVGIGTTNPNRQLSIFSTDTVITGFVGSNADASVITVTGLNPNAATGAVFLTGPDSGIVAMDPQKKTFFLSNSTVDGHIAIVADSSTVLYGNTVGTVAQDLILNQSKRIYNEIDTIFNYSSGSQVINVNQGSFLTDSLYVLGKNVNNLNWILANDGFGQAVWKNPSLLGSTSSWQSNTPDIYFNTGKVGVGTINPQQLLTISSPTSTTIRMERASVSAYDWELNVDNLGFHIKGGADSVGPGLTDFVNIDGFGKMGLGITTPTQKLHIYNGTLRIDDGANPYNLPSSDGATSGQVMTTDAAGNVTWQTPSSALWQSNSPDIYFNTGNVGIGTTGPTANLEVLNNNNEKSFVINNSSATTNSYLIDGSNTGTGTGNKFGSKIDVTGTGGIGNYGGYFTASGATNENVGAFGQSIGMGAGSTTIGVFGLAAGGGPGTSKAVYGYNPGAVSGTSYAGHFVNDNSGSDLAYGIKSDVGSSSATTQYGVSTEMIANVTATKYGIYADVRNGTINNWAGYFAKGNVYVADTLVLPTNAGIGKILTSDANGNASWQPNQIAFEVRGTTQLIDNTPRLLQTDVIQLDDGGNFDPSAGNYMFVAPISGVYTFQTNVLFDYNSAGPDVETIVEVLVNGSPVYTSLTPIRPGEKKTNNNSSTIRLSANDQLQVRVHINGGGSTVMTGGADQVWFSGHLVYAY